MKKYLLAVASLVLCAGLSRAQPQSAPHPRRPMPGAPHGPDFAGPTGRLFAGNPAFTASLEMLITNASPGRRPIIFEGNLAVSDSKSRFEIDMTKTAGARANPKQAANLKGMGMDKLILISRPDLKVSDMLYPGFNAYVEAATPDGVDKTAGTSKVETTELGRETIDGHPCVKNKVVVTDDQGNQHVSTVWNATDLNHFPVKIVQDENGSVTTLNFKDVKLGSVGTDQFSPPAGATKYDNINTLMQQEIMKRATIIRGTP